MIKKKRKEFTPEQIEEIRTKDFFDMIYPTKKASESKSMSKKTITISFDEEKLNALKMYLTQKNMQAEKELEKALETLYNKTVPAGVREFIEMKSGTAPKPTEKSRKPKAVPSSAVGVSDQTDGDSV